MSQKINSFHAVSVNSVMRILVVTLSRFRLYVTGVGVT